MHLEPQKRQNTPFRTDIEKKNTYCCPKNPQAFLLDFFCFFVLNTLTVYKVMQMKKVQLESPPSGGSALQSPHIKE